MTYFTSWLLCMIPIAIVFLILYLYDEEDSRSIGLGILIIGMLLTWLSVWLAKPSYIQSCKYAIGSTVIITSIGIGLQILSSEKRSRVIRVLAIAIILLPTFGFFYARLTQGTIPNAVWMEENTIIYESTSSNPMYPFENEPDTSTLRFITEEFAISIANQKASELGSNSEVAKANVVKINGSLYWCVMYRHTSTTMQRQINGLILVDVNNPNVDPIVIKTDNWFYAETLSLGNSMDRTRWEYEKHNVWRSNVRHYPAYDDNLDEWVYVSTATKEDINGIIEFNGLYITDVETGATLDYYTPDDIKKGDIPDYCIQVVSEKYLEKMVNTWGKYRDTSENGNIDRWSGSFINGRSSDLFKMTEDLRYIINPDNSNQVIGIIPIVPRNKEGTLYGYVKIYPNMTMEMYNMINFGFISPNVASSTVKSLLTQPNEGDYDAGMPILFYVNTTSGIKAAYYVPVYWTDNTTYRLSHFAIVSAKDTSYTALVESSGKSPSVSASEALLQFKNLYSGDEEEEEVESAITAKINAIGSYIEEGNTIFVFDLNTTDIIRLSRDYISDSKWNDVVLCNVGDEIRYTASDTNGILWCNSFTKL